MRKSFVLALPVSLLSASLAYADNNQIDSFMPVNGENATADGSAILRHHSGRNDTTVMAILTGFAPNTVYDFELFSPTQGSVAAYDVLHTDDFGNVSFKTTFTGNYSDADAIVYLSEDTYFTQEEIRAIGLQSLTLVFTNSSHKIDSVMPVNGENTTADGKAILHYIPGLTKTSVMIILTGFAPNTSYDFELVSPTQGSVAAFDVLQSDEFGNVSLNTLFSGDITDADLVIYLSDDTYFSQDEIRAIGAQSN